MIYDPPEYVLRYVACTYGVDYVDLLLSPEGRKTMTAVDPYLFSIIYFWRTVAGDQPEPSFGEHHAEWFAIMNQLRGELPPPSSWRHFFCAPRGSSKSTTWYRFMPLWVGAHRHRKFVVAFAETAGQAELHLSSFKQELDTNKLLRSDFPEFVKAARRPAGQSIADNRGMYISGNGFIFAARGFDTGSLGLLYGDDRPDIILLDDIEPKEGAYSDAQVKKNLQDLRTAIYPLVQAEKGFYIWTGTVTKANSMTHQLVKTVQAPGDEPAKWTKEDRWQVHYYPVLLSSPDGSARSLWSSVYSMDWIKANWHIRTWQKEYMNSPIPDNSPFWKEEDIVHFSDGIAWHQELKDTAVRWVLSIDPPLSSKSTSDWAGFAIIGYSPQLRRCLVRKIWHRKLTGSPLREHAMATIAAYPEIKRIILEVNAGGAEMWINEVFRNEWMPEGVKVRTVVQPASFGKRTRAGLALEWYQTDRVVHEQYFVDAEMEMLSFTGKEGNSDDMVDAVGTGLNYFLGADRSRPASVRVMTYA